MNDWNVLCTSEQTHDLTRPCNPADTRAGLKRNTDDEKEKKEKEQGYTMTFPTKTDVNFALRFETFDRPPYNKNSSCNLSVFHFLQRWYFQYENTDVSHVSMAATVG